jgi:hypothetical protein
MGGRAAGDLATRRGDSMSLTTLLIIVLLFILFFGGGGYYWHSRR